MNSEYLSFGLFLSNNRKISIRFHSYHYMPVYNWKKGLHWKRTPVSYRLIKIAFKTISIIIKFFITLVCLDLVSERWNSFWDSFVVADLFLVAKIKS